jgi:hypothetical protein
MTAEDRAAYLLGGLLDDDAISLRAPAPYVIRRIAQAIEQAETAAKGSVIVSSRQALNEGGTGG